MYPPSGTQMVMVKVEPATIVQPCPKVERRKRGFDWTQYLGKPMGNHLPTVGFQIVFKTLVHVKLVSFVAPQMILRYSQSRPKPLSTAKLMR